MELRHVRVCLALADELHFGRTAARLRVAQSAVSHTIQDLERELGVTLFVRGRRAGPLSRLVPEGRDQHCAGRNRRAARPHRRRQLRHRLHEPQEGRGAARHRGHRERGAAGGRPGRTPLRPPGPGGPARAGPGKARLSPPGGRARGPRLLPPPMPGGRLQPGYRDGDRSAGALLALVAAGVGISCVPGFVRRIRFPGVKAIPLSPTVPAGISAVWDPRTLPATGLRFLELLRGGLRDEHSVNLAV